VVKPLTKYAVTIDDPNTIRYHLEKAVSLARSGRPGPVWVDIPIDVQGAPIDDTALPGYLPETPAPAPTDSPSAASLSEQVSKIIAMLNGAERPVLMIGNGVRLAGAEAVLEETVRLLNVPVETTWVAMDLIGDADPLFVGRPGTVAARGANFALQNCDFLLAIGARMDLPIVGYTPENMARGAWKAMVDVDAAELRKMGSTVHMPVCADARQFIEELLRQRDRLAKRDRCCWIKRCQDWKSRYPVVTDEHRRPEGRVSIYNLAEVIAAETVADDCIVSGSSGSGIEVFLFAFPVRKGQRVYHTAGLGAMGFAIPASIGVCLASGGRRTVCVDGDGGFQSIKFFVLNNEGYASIRASQTNFFGAPSIGCGPETGMRLPDFRKVARAYGLKTAIIEDQSDLRAAVRKVLRMKGPVVCDVKVIPDEVRAPRLSSVQRPDGSFVSKPLEDLWPFLDREEFLANMIVPPLPE
jgi:acetolactate synthase-1/2/3 large subunit